MKVQATRLGFYDNKRQKEGTIFVLAKSEHFSDSWMKKLDSGEDKDAEEVAKINKKQAQETFNPTPRAGKSSPSPFFAAKGKGPSATGGEDKEGSSSSEEGSTGLKGKVASAAKSVSAAVKKAASGSSEKKEEA